MTHKLLSIVGTRPEVIKMAPLLTRLGEHPLFESQLCLTRQHAELVEPLLDYFSLTPAFRLPLAPPANQSLNALLAGMLEQLDAVLEEARPDMVLVHGDTTSCLAGALAAFHHGIPIGHVEAGLRTANLDSPHPEEANRALVDRLAILHFAPTLSAADNLRAEQIAEHGIFVTGSTAIDALVVASADNRRFDQAHWPDIFGPRLARSLTNEPSRLILATGHRRENIDSALEFVCEQLRALAELHPDWDIAFPVHLNPLVHGRVTARLQGLANVHLLPPLHYPHFIKLMSHCRLVVTDSGGIQEEAPYLGKPVLVTRDNTERPEGLQAGVQLGSRQPQEFRNQIEALMEAGPADSAAQALHIYGSGNAAGFIVDALESVMATQGRLLASS